MQDEGGRPAWALRITQSRLALGWSQYRLAAELAGLIGRRTGQPADPENVRRGLTEWEKGRRQPLAQSWELLACALDVSVPWLRDRTREEDDNVERRELLHALGLVGVAGLTPHVAASRRVA
jgi:transcriptional regulator with XRE-family HTH domain